MQSGHVLLSGGAWANTVAAKTVKRENNFIMFLFDCQMSLRKFKITQLFNSRKMKHMALLPWLLYPPCADYVNMLPHKS